MLIPYKAFLINAEH